MKKLTLLLLLIVPICLFGKNVKKETILKVAEKVYRKDFPATQNVAFDNVIVVKNETDTLYYIVSYPKDGFVIVSADSSAPPVLGNCKKGAYDPEIMPPGLLVLLERYKFSIAEIKAKKIKQSEKIKKQWEEYTDENYLTLKSYSVGSNMISTEWGQRGGFNRFCPDECPAGCSAVAMAQVLWYWKCKIESDWGSYSWKNMNLDTSDDDNASLIYHCGLACDTNYGTNSSSSTPNKVKNGLRDHMGCQSNVDVIWQNSHLFNWQEWLEDEIDQERPIIYNAGNLEFDGHSWVIDGYNSVGEFHCNWGWYGQYNGYFSIGDFSTPNGSFNTLDSAIIKIIPEQDNGVGTPQIQEYNLTYNPNGNVITTPEVFGATSYQWETSNGTIVGSGSSATLFSDCSSVIKVRAYNENCEIYSPYDTEILNINYGTISGPSLVCSSGSTFSVSNLPPGALVDWSCTSTNNNLTIDPTSGYAYATSSTPGPATITVNVATNCGGVTLPAKTVWVGVPLVSYITDPAGGSNPFNFYAMPSPNYSTTDYYTWIVSPYGYANIYSWMDHAEITFPEPMCYRIEVQATNACGCSDLVYKYFNYYGDYLMSPNPASNEVEITISTGEAEGSKSANWSSDDAYTVTVLDIYGTVKIQKKNSGNKFTIPVGSLKDGNYFVKVNNKKINSTKQLIVKH